MVIPHEFILIDPINSIADKWQKPFRRRVGSTLVDAHIMKLLHARALVFIIGLVPLVLGAQTWIGGSSGNVFNFAGNWSPSGIPGSNASLVFNSPTNANIGFNTLPYTANSLTFTSAATNQFFINGNGGTLTINSGITTQAGSGGANFSTGVNLALGADQTWTTASTVTVSGSLSGAFALTKEGSGNLILSGNNSYSGGTTVNAGTLFLGQSNSTSGTVTVGSGGTLGASNGDLVLSNAVTLASGATLGTSPFNNDSHIELSGTVTLASPTATLNIGTMSDVFFGGTLTAGAPTALTVQGDGTGIAIMNGSQTNITSMTADNAAIAFGKTAALPTTQIHATNGGYVSVAKLDSAPPSVAGFMALITDKANFSGVLGFDTDEDQSSPYDYTDNINLAGFTNGNVRLGSVTSAILSGTITPVGQSYDFGGYAMQDGLLVVKSNLTELNATTTSLSLVSPTASGGAPQNGMVLALQGTNGFSGNISVSYSSLLLDSAISGTTNINLGAYSYAGFTETVHSGLNFATLASRVAAGGYTATSVLGIDSHDILAEYVDGTPFTSFHTITGGSIDLSAFTSIYLGTLTGATISSSTVITTPTDGTLRLVNMGESGGLIINRVLNHANGLVAGMDGSEGAVILAADNTYTGGTSLLSGQLLVGDTSTTALGSGALTVAATSGNMPALGTALGSASLANNITLNGPLEVGTGETDDDDQRYLAGTTSLTLSGVISGTGQLHVTGLTTLSGANTYSGGTFVLADTTVSNNSGLGTGSVFVGYKDSDSDAGVPVTPLRATLTFNTTAPSIGSLMDASQFVFQGGTGNINMGVASTTLTVNQSVTGTFSGQFTGNTFALVKAGAQQLTLTGANAGQLTSTTINAGSLAIGNSQATTATYGGDIAINVTGANTGLFFRPGGSQSMTYGGSISGAGAVTVNGSGAGTTLINGGSSSFTGNTTVASGKLQIGGDNFWSASSATTVQGGATLQLDGHQTIKNLSGGGTVTVASGKILTVDSVAGSTFSGALGGAGGLTKTGAATTFTISGANTFTGNTTVSAGTLMVNSSLFTSPVITVDSGATLMGTGALNDLTLNGTYRPGLNSAAALTTQDNLTMGSTGLIHMELGGSTRGTNYDALNVANAFAVDGTLSVTFINAFNPTLGATFNLFDFASLSGTFDTLNLQALGGGLAWNTSALYTTGVLSVSAIPEPSTYAMFAGLAVLGLAIWRRRSAKVRAGVQVVARL
jgi:fibronectin-binding autotransporter adhesin